MRRVMASFERLRPFDFDFRINSAHPAKSAPIHISAEARRLTMRSSAKFRRKKKPLTASSRPIANFQGSPPPEDSDHGKPRLAGFTLE